MDRHVPPQVTYWTGTWDPVREAISKEIETLRRHRGPLAPVVSFSNGQRTALAPKDRVLTLAADRWLTLRGVARLLEPRGDVSHLFGGADDWHLLRVVGRRPVLFTVAIPGGKPAVALWDRVSVFAAETTMLGQALVDAGAPRDRVIVVSPGVDLEMFVPSPAKGPRFRLLFASSPARTSEFEARGIPLLVEVARHRPEIDVVLLWRAWGDQDAARHALAALAPPSNLRIEVRGGRPMTEVYQSAHAVACFYQPGYGKSAPNSVVEALACGRPALVADTSGLADLIDGARAGAAIPRDAETIAAAIDHLRARYDEHSVNARRLAERTFDARTFRSSYETLYAALAAAPHRCPAPVGVAAR